MPDIIQTDAEHGDGPSMTQRYPEIDADHYAVVLDEDAEEVRLFDGREEVWSGDPADLTRIVRQSDSVLAER